MTTSKRIRSSVTALCSRVSPGLCSYIAVIILLIYGVGCGLIGSSDRYLGTTKATYGDLTWESNKNQENLDAKFWKDGDKTTFAIKTTATTPEAAMAAASQANAEAWRNLSEFMKELLPLIKQGAAAGS